MLDEFCILVGTKLKTLADHEIIAGLIAEYTSSNHRLKSAFDMLVHSFKKQYRRRFTPR